MENNTPSKTDDRENEDTHLEPDEEIVSEENAQEKIKKLRVSLKAALKEKDEYLAGWQRAKADNLNARRLADEARKDTIAFANQNLIEELIPALQSFESAFSNKEAWEKVDRNWRVGVEYIHSQLLKVLADNGLQEVSPLGQKFDPARDEVVSYIPVEDSSKDHTVVGIVQKGYSLHGKQIVAPKVTVGEFRKV